MGFIVQVFHKELAQRELLGSREGRISKQVKTLGLDCHSAETKILKISDKGNVRITAILIPIDASKLFLGRVMPVISGTTPGRASVRLAYVVWGRMSLRLQPRRQPDTNDIVAKPVRRGRRRTG